MAGILIIAHGTLGESLIHCASHVLNKRPPRLKQLGVTAQDDPLLLLPQARALVKELDDGGGVLILSDMYGGSPSNIAAKLLIPGRVEGVAGVNLPMLIRALTYRDKPLATLLIKAVSGGCEGVMRIPVLSLHNAATGS
ncbi:MAG TPA: PTS fructose transporter subunit IIA [Burkholderiales bacterium]|jgi:PTS system mannose-specific IIA component|nr:PTS fructose transporter subunit IIA [Burkholderiales bacterium]